MSTLKVNTILSETPTVNITDGLNVTGVSTVTTLNTTNLINATALSNRNIIINGAMEVAQRGTSSTTSGYGSVDRFSTQNTGTDEAPTHAQVDVSSGTTPYSLGFRKALKITNGNQTSGAGAADYIKFTTKLEAQDIASSGWNYVSSSSNITLSYWVRSSVAQTFFVRVTAMDSPVYNFPFSYAVSANTWTKVTKSIPGNSNLNFDFNNAVGLDIEWTLFRGTDTTGSGATLDTWAAYDSSQRQPDNTSTWYTTNDATWEITGVQLEVGSVATPFEHRTHADELKRCSRYYQKIAEGNQKAIALAYGYNAQYLDWVLHNPMGPMRTNPSLDQVNGSDYYNYYNSSQGGIQLDGAFIIEHGQICQSNVYFDPDGTVNPGESGYLKTNNAAAYLAVQAEL